MSIRLFFKYSSIRTWLNEVRRLGAIISRFQNFYNSQIENLRLTCFWPRIGEFGFKIERGIIKYNIFGLLTLLPHGTNKVFHWILLICFLSCTRYGQSIPS